jgi:transposase
MTLDHVSQRRAQIVDLHKNGLRGRAIARELGVALALVSLRLREARESGVDLGRWWATFPGVTGLITS